ncbi:MAG: ABC transporter permease [Bacteroidales bacterium]|nr:ABC transporter permease [Bacteroidales bacterium]
MLNFKLVFRNLFKIRSYTILNITGLGIGFACTFAVIVWVKNELSYDKHLPDSNRIYRLTFETDNSGNRIHFARCWEKWIWQMPEFFPQIEELVRLEPYRHTAIKIGESKFYSDRVFATDTNFFKVFDIDLISGEAEKVLREPYSAVISTSLAKKCFGTTNPVGQSLLLSGEYDTKMVLFTIKGVMNDTPVNSHIHFDILTSFARPEEAPAWAYVYLLLRPNSSPDEILSRFPSFISKAVEKQDQNDFIPHLQRITDIHLFSNKDREVEPNGSIISIYLFVAIALVLLLVSWVNYYNLSKTMLLTLQKQIHIQRIAGSNNKLIILQSLAESGISVALALILSWILLDLSESYSLSVFGFRLLPNGYSDLSDIWLFVIAIISVSVFTGSLPVITYVLKETKSIPGFKGSWHQGNRGLTSYGILMTGQFCLSIILMVAAITIYRQKELMFSLSLGDMSSDILVFKKQNWEVRFKYNEFRNKALQNHLIKSVTAAMAEPSGETVDALGIESPAIEKSLEENRLYVLSVEDNFLDFFNIPLIAGRNFSLYNPNRKGEDYILNETAVKRLGWTPDEAIGKPFKIKFDTPDIFYGGTVVGVVRDFNFNTIKQEIKPYVLFQKPIFYLCFLVKVDSARKGEAIADLKTIWEEELPDYPFQYEFISDLYRSAYSRELSQAKITSLFSFLAMVIICFGLFSVTSVLVARRTKEIGIRKVNGAMLPEILVMLNSDFIRWVAIAFIIACPAGWFVMNKWLQNFVYRTEINWWIFALAGLIALGIALITVSWQSWRAATRNPVEALRYE